MWYAFHMHPTHPTWSISADEHAADAHTAWEGAERAGVSNARLDRIQAHVDRADAAADAAASALCQAEGERHARRADAHARSAIRLALAAIRELDA